MALLQPWNHRSGKTHIKSPSLPLWPKGGSAVTELFLTAAHPSSSQRPPEMETFEFSKIISPHSAVEPGTCTAPLALLWEARDSPQTLWTALEKESKKVSALGLCYKTAPPLLFIAFTLSFLLVSSARPPQDEV